MKFSENPCKLSSKCYKNMDILSRMLMLIGSQ